MFLSLYIVSHRFTWSTGLLLWTAKRLFHRSQHRVQVFSKQRNQQSYLIMTFCPKGKSRYISTQRTVQCEMFFFSVGFHSNHIITYPILSYPILSYPILSYIISFILSYPILCFCSDDLSFRCRSNWAPQWRALKRARTSSRRSFTPRTSLTSLMTSGSCAPPIGLNPQVPMPSTTVSNHIWRAVRPWLFSSCCTNGCSNRPTTRGRLVWDTR